MKGDEVLKMYALVHSETEHEFKIETVQQMILANWNCLRGEKNAGASDWIVVAIVDTAQEAEALRDKWNRGMDFPPEGG